MSKSVTSDSLGGWDIDTYAAHNEALRLAEEKFQDERDRRYAEVDIEKEKALKIKETADLAALSLARDIQIYKDEKANELREQINRERTEYASKGDLRASVEKIEATLGPVLTYVASQQGVKTQQSESRGTNQWVIGLVLSLPSTITSVILLVLLLAKPAA